MIEPRRVRRVVEQAGPFNERHSARGEVADPGYLAGGPFQADDVASVDFGEVLGAVGGRVGGADVGF